MAAFLVMGSGEASAHEVIPGVTGFPALMLHPLVVPEQLLLLIAAGLVAGRMPASAFVSAGIAFVVGLLAGKGAHLVAHWLSAFWYAPLVLVLVAGVGVTVFGSFRRLPGIALVFALAFVLSVGIVPEEPSIQGLANAMAATALTGLVVIGLIGWPLGRVRSHWGGIIVRVAGAWLAAIALINLALSFSMMANAG